MTKAQEVLSVAQGLYEQKPDWVTFFREVLGLDGIARQAFQSAEQMAAFEKTDEYQKIQQMVSALRKKGGEPNNTEPTTVITVRLPKSLHDTLKAEAHDRKTSMNKLCISKLLEPLPQLETAVS